MVIQYMTVFLKFVISSTGAVIMINTPGTKKPSEATT